MLLAIAIGLAAAQTVPPPEAHERKICRSYATTGSMFPSKRECHTRAEWAEIDQRNAEANQQMRDWTRNRGARTH